MYRLGEACLFSQSNLFGILYPAHSDLTKTTFSSGPQQPARVPTTLQLFVEIDVSESASTNWSVKQTTNWDTGVCFEVDLLTQRLMGSGNTMPAALRPTLVHLRTPPSKVWIHPLDDYAAGFAFDPAHHQALFFEPENGYVECIPFSLHFAAHPSPHLHGFLLDGSQLTCCS